MYRKINSIILSFLIIFSSIQVNGQGTKLVGKIIDKKTKESIPGVYVIINGIPLTFSDEKGGFEFNLPKVDKLDVTFSHLAYKPVTLPTTNLKSDTVKIEMSEILFGLGEIIVTSEKTKTLIKKIHKHFRENYRSYCYWAKSHYQQRIIHNGLTKGYLEIVGYSYMPVPDSYVFRGQPLIVPIELRRTRENGIISKLLNDRHNAFNQIGPSLLTKAEFAFFERIHPLGLFNFNDYELCLDTTGTQLENQYVLNYKQKKKFFSVVGWPILGCMGKIWIDRNTLDIVKINGEFNRGNNMFTRIEVDYLRNEKFIYPKSIKTSTIFNRNNGEKLQEQILIASELTFLNIDTQKQPNYYRKKGYQLEFLLSTITGDYEYHPLFWKKSFPLSREWKDCVSQLNNGNLDEEFSIGAKEPIFIKGGFGYQGYTGRIKESSLKFVEQMKKDLNLND